MSPENPIKLQLRIRSDKAATYTRLYHSFINSLPPSLRETVTDSDSGRLTRLTISDIKDLDEALTALKAAISREIKWMKTAHHSVLVRKGGDYTKKEYLIQRIKELEEIAPASDEMTTHLNELITIEHSADTCDRLNTMIDNFSDYVNSIQNLKSEASISPRGVVRELEMLLSDILSMALEADRVALLTNSILEEDENKEKIAPE